HGSLELAFGVNQEIGGRHDVLSSLESIHDIEVISSACSAFDLPRLEVAAAVVNESNLPRAGLEDTRCRNHQPAAQFRIELHADEHAERKLHLRVRNFEADLRGARGLVNLRPNEAQSTGKCASRIGVHSEAGGVFHSY